jgi:hypothetical protein
MLYRETGRYPIDMIMQSWIFGIKLYIAIKSSIQVSIMTLWFYCEHPFIWSEFVKNILNNTGHSYLFLNQSSLTSKSIHVLIKQVIVDQFITDWNANYKYQVKVNCIIFSNSNTNVKNILQFTKTVLRTTS